MNTQRDIRSTIKSARNKDNPDNETLRSFEKRLESLNIPKYDSVDFNPTSWDRFIRDITDVECLELRSYFDVNSDEYRILSAIAAHRSNNEDYIKEAMNISIKGDPSDRLRNKIPKVISEIIFRVPISVLLSAWVSEIYICDDKEYKKLTNNESSGYYDPDGHWIAIRYDVTESNSEFWPVSFKQTQDNYESSVTIHEFGHALHYMFGLQTDDPDNRDHRNVNIEESDFSLKKDILRGKSQSEFCINCSKAYGLTIDNTYETLNWKNRLKINIEEFVAECFVVYVTSPRYLAKKQPLAFSIFNNLTN